MQVFGLVLVLVALSQALDPVQRQVLVKDDGSIVVTGGNGKVVTIQKPVVGQNMEIFVKPGMNLPTKKIQIIDQSDSSNTWMDVVRSRRFKTGVNPQFVVLQNIFKDYQGVNGEKSFDKLLGAVEKYVQKGELNADILPILRDLNIVGGGQILGGDIDVVPGYSVDGVLERIQVVNQVGVDDVVQQLIQEYSLNNQDDFPQEVIEYLLQKLYRQNQLLRINQSPINTIIQKLIKEGGVDGMVFVESSTMRLFQALNNENRIIKNQVILQLIQDVIQSRQLPQQLVEDLLQILYQQAEIQTKDQIKMLIEQIDVNNPEIVQLEVKLLQVLSIQNLAEVKLAVLKLLKDLTEEYQISNDPVLLMVIQEVLQKLYRSALLVKQPLVSKILLQITQDLGQVGVQQKIEILILLKQQILVQIQRGIEPLLQQVMSYETNGQILQQLLQNIYDQNELNKQINVLDLQEMQTELGPTVNQIGSLGPLRRNNLIGQTYWQNIPPVQKWALQNQLLGQYQGLDYPTGRIYGGYNQYY